MKQKTAIQDFCDFLEKELQITMSNENWKIYHEQKKMSVESAKEQIVGAYNSGYLFYSAHELEDGDTYYNETFEQTN